MFENYPHSSRLWVFGANRFLSRNEEEVIRKELDSFLRGWATHGKDLYGSFDILHDNFIVIAVDEDKVPASGCSIDTLTQFIKSLEKSLGISFFDRLKILIKKDEEYKRIHFSDLTQFPDWKMFNPMVSNVKDFNEKWFIPVSEFKP